MRRVRWGPVLVGRGERYQQWHADPRIAARTSFFAAAAVVSRALARIPWTGFLLPLSGALELENARRARQICRGTLYSHPSVASNTVDFIRFEQGLVQIHLDRARQIAPQRFTAQLRAYNAAFSLLHATRLRCGVEESFVAGVADTVHEIGRSIDLADRACREILGMYIARYAAMTGAVLGGRAARRPLAPGAVAKAEP